MKAIIYLRISQDRTGLAAGVERQTEDCRRRAEAQGWTVAAVLSDNDVSAYSGKRRPGFEALLAALSSGEVDVVVAWSLDRLQRNRADEARLYELCKERAATISLVNGSDLDFSTAGGRFVADVLGSQARMEVEMKSDRQKRAQQQAAKSGKRVGGRRPFGYLADGVTVREDEAEAVRQAYAGYLAGDSLSSIARRWNEAKLLGEQGAQWRHDTVRQVLLNPRYAGKRAYLGEVVAEAQWPALVPDETWQAAVGILTHPSRKVGPRPASHLLSGIAQCGVCGDGTPLHAGGNARTGKPGLRCSATLGHVARMAQPVEDYVTAVVLGRLAREDAADLLAPAEVKPDTAVLREEATALRARLDAVATEFADGDLTASQLRTITGRLRDRLTAAESALADAGRESILGSLVGGADPAEVWESLDLDRRRAVIDLLCRVIVFPPGRGTRTFRPETVQIEWKS